MDLRTKYDQAIQVAKSLHMEGSAQEKDGKLFFVGTVKSEDEKNRIWNALKTVGAEAIFPPGTVIAEAAEGLLDALNRRLGHTRAAAE
jgi:methylmalonyl-CoA mutase cobalamin-binding subunit